MNKTISIKFSGYYVNGERCDRDALNKAIAELNEENEISNIKQYRHAK